MISRHMLPHLSAPVLVRSACLLTLILLAAKVANAAPPELEVAPGKPRPREVKAIMGLMLGTDEADRVVVMDIASNSAAANIGVEKGDRLISIDGHIVSTIDEVVEFGNKSIVTKLPGQEVKIVIMRNGKTRTLTALVPDRPKPAPATVVIETVRPPLPIEREREPLLCMQVREIAGGGLIVQRVLERSPAHRAGVQPQDVILSVDRIKVRTLPNFNEAIRGYAPGQTISLGLLRGERPFVATFVIAPCRAVSPDLPVVPPGPVATAETVESLSLKVRALQIQIDEMKSTIDAMAVTIEGLRRK